MKFNMNGMRRFASMGGLKIRKSSPELMIIGGIAGMIAGTVMACKATLKVDEVLEETKEKIDKVHTTLNDEERNPNQEKYTIEDSKKDLAIVYSQTALRFVKLYGPSVIVAGLSIGAILSGHNITRQRNLALAAAYTGLDKTFRDYRSRVAERFGDTVEDEVRRGIKAMEIEESETDPETGEVKTVKKTVNFFDPNGYSQFARVFDDSCRGFDPDDHDYNRSFLLHTQNWANDKLKSDGYLLLNDVYLALGFDKTTAGSVVGWVYDEKNQVGDNYVDFGLFDTHTDSNRYFINGHDKYVVIDFNVDGPVYELIDQIEEMRKAALKA